MGETFYCILKLVSAEEIFSLVSVDENNGDPIVILQNPVIMKLFTNHTGSYIKIKPWVDLSSEDIFIIRMDKIVTMTETNDKKLINVYDNYINNEQSIDIYENNFLNENKVKISNKMGYITSVEEARKRLEDLFKDSKES